MKLSEYINKKLKAAEEKGLREVAFDIGIIWKESTIHILRGSNNRIKFTVINETGVK